jgi:hypothetical protein
MAKTNAAKTRDRTRHPYKGTTSRPRERLKGALLLLVIPALILVAALARGVEEYHGEVPDWRPAPPAAESAH